MKIQARYVRAGDYIWAFGSPRIVVQTDTAWCSWPGGKVNIECHPGLPTGNELWISKDPRRDD